MPSTPQAIFNRFQVSLEASAPNPRALWMLQAILPISTHKNRFGVRAFIHVSPQTHAVTRLIDLHHGHNEVYGIKEAEFNAQAILAKSDAEVQFWKLGTHPHLDKLTLNGSGEGAFNHTQPPEGWSPKDQLTWRAAHKNDGVETMYTLLSGLVLAPHVLKSQWKNPLIKRLQQVQTDLLQGHYTYGSSQILQGGHFKTQVTLRKFAPVEQAPAS